MEWAPHIYRNPNNPHKKMLEMHPIPEYDQKVILVVKALDAMSGDRINTGSKIPYSSKVLWLDRNIPIKDQRFFENLLEYADDIHAGKTIELQNNEMKRQQAKQNREAKF